MPILYFFSSFSSTTNVYFNFHLNAYCVHELFCQQLLPHSLSHNCLIFHFLTSISISTIQHAHDIFFKPPPHECSCTFFCPLSLVQGCRKAHAKMNAIDLWLWIYEERELWTLPQNFPFTSPSPARIVEKINSDAFVVCFSHCQHVRYIATSATRGRMRGARTRSTTRLCPGISPRSWHATAAAWRWCGMRKRVSV
jgi:hypothetical protein